MDAEALVALILAAFPGAEEVTQPPGCKDAAHVESWWPTAPGRVECALCSPEQHRVAGAAR
jgi:hypothetical protein